MVSTHSHPKVAANRKILLKTITYSFNTQPPEGGCHLQLGSMIDWLRFQHTATRRWLRIVTATACANGSVSTHSHPKVAAPKAQCRVARQMGVSTHSHPKVAATVQNLVRSNLAVSTHSHPKVAAPYIKK